MLSAFRKDERGFTLVELLVVILVIGILLAIILPTFNAQRVKAQDAEAKAAASLVTKALIVYHHDHKTFATADENALTAIEPAISDVPSFAIDAGVDRFELSVDSTAGAAGGGPFLVEHDEGATEHRCTTPGKGGCPDSGLW